MGTNELNFLVIFVSFTCRSDRNSLGAASSARQSASTAARQEVKTLMVFGGRCCYCLEWKKISFWKVALYKKVDGKNMCFCWVLWVKAQLWEMSTPYQTGLETISVFTKGLVRGRAPLSSFFVRWLDDGKQRPNTSEANKGNLCWAEVSSPQIFH